MGCEDYDIDFVKGERAKTHNFFREEAKNLGLKVTPIDHSDQSLKVAGPILIERIGDRQINISLHSDLMFNPDSETIADAWTSMTSSGKIDKNGELIDDIEQLTLYYNPKHFCSFDFFNLYIKWMHEKYSRAKMDQILLPYLKKWFPKSENV